MDMSIVATARLKSYIGNKHLFFWKKCKVALFNEIFANAPLGSPIGNIIPIIVSYFGIIYVCFFTPNFIYHMKYRPSFRLACIKSGKCYSFYNFLFCYSVCFCIYQMIFERIICWTLSLERNNLTREQSRRDRFLPAVCFIVNYKLFILSYNLTINIIKQYNF